MFTWMFVHSQVEGGSLVQVILSRGRGGGSQVQVTLPPPFSPASWVWLNMIRTWGGGGSVLPRNVNGRLLF